MFLAYNILSEGLVAKWQGSGLQNRDSAVQIRPRPLLKISFQQNRFSPDNLIASGCSCLITLDSKL